MDVFPDNLSFIMGHFTKILRKVAGRLGSGLISLVWRAQRAGVEGAIGVTLISQMQNWHVT